MSEQARKESVGRVFGWIARASAIGCFVFGGLTIAGIYSGWRGLAQTDSSLFLIISQAGLGLFIAGTGLWAVLHNHRKLTAFCGAILTLGGAFYTGVNGIRYFSFFERMPLDSLPYPEGNSMQLNLAVSFLLTGIFYLCALKENLSNRISVILCHVEALVFALGFSSIAGVLLHLYQSSQFAITPQTAVGLLILGVGLLAASTRNESVYFQIKIVLLIGISLSLVIFNISMDRESNAIRTKFEAQAKNLILLINREIAIDIEAIKSLKVFYDNSHSVERSEFKQFSVSILADHPAVLVLEWAPYITNENRAAFEAGKEDLPITVKNLNDAPMTEKRDYYFPLQYAEPLSQYQQRLGFDLASDPEVLKDLKKSWEQQSIAASEILLIDKAAGFRVFDPVFEKDAPLKATNQDFKGLQGFVIGILSVKKIIDSALVYTAHPDMELNIYETTLTPRLFYRHSPGRNMQSPQATDPKFYAKRSLKYISDLDVLGEKWTVVCLPVPRYLKAYFPWLPWMLFLVLLVATLAFARYLWRATKQNIYVENEVRARTAELSVANVALQKSYEDLRCELNMRKQAEDALKDNEMKYQQILNAITDMILVKGPKSRIIWANKSFTDCYGMSNEQLKGIIDAPFVEPDFTQQYVRDDEYVFNTGKVLNVEEEPVKMHDGRIIFVQTIKTPIRDDNGRVIMTVGVSRDITDKKKAQEELRNAQARALQSEKLASIGQLSAGIAHEVKNPLAIILLGLEQYEKGMLAGEMSSGDFIKMIRKAAKRANEVIYELLRFSRVGDLELKPMLLNNIIQATLTLAHNSTKMKEIELKVELASEEIIVQADNIALEQVLINLITNAADAIDNAGTIGIRTFLRKAVDDQCPEAIIEIEDSGAGIPPEIVDKIFEPFFTTKEQGKGTGLGLSTAYSLVQAHHGRIEVKSQMGKGTVFSVILPVFTDHRGEENK